MRFSEKRIKGRGEYLSYCSARFRSLEVNSTFYRLPLETTLARWRDLTPPGFVFAVKASRFITHTKRLDDPEQTIAPFLDRIRCLGAKLGQILLQLPSRFPFKGNKLDAFCKALDKNFRYAFEFHDPDWFRLETCDILSRHGMAFCCRGASTGKPLEGWTEKIRRWMKEGRTVYGYFDNTMEGDAVNDAMKLPENAESGDKP